MKIENCTAASTHSMHTAAEGYATRAERTSMLAF